MTHGKYKAPHEAGVEIELINDVKLIKLIVMRDCATRNQARIKLGLATVGGGGNEYITKQEALDLGADSTPLNKYIGPKELVAIEDIQNGELTGAVIIEALNFPLEIYTECIINLTYTLYNDNNDSFTKTLNMSVGYSDPTGTGGAAYNRFEFKYPKSFQYAKGTFTIDNFEGRINNTYYQDWLFDNVTFGDADDRLMQYDNIQGSQLIHKEIPFSYAGAFRELYIDIDGMHPLN